MKRNNTQDRTTTLLYNFPVIKYVSYFLEKFIIVICFLEN